MAPDGTESNAREGDNSEGRVKETGDSMALRRFGALLGEVISHTDQLFSVAGDKQGEPEVLREVARRHPGEELTVDPVILELVEAVIRDLINRIGRDELRREVIRHVAESLHDDPAAFKRLSSLWNSLQRSLQ